MVWSDEVNDYVRRYGRGGIGQVRRNMDVVREAIPGEEYSDPF